MGEHPCSVCYVYVCIFKSKEGAARVVGDNNRVNRRRKPHVAGRFLALFGCWICSNFKMDGYENPPTQPQSVSFEFDTHCLVQPFRS